jgi:SAM-dependent methyltransferase
VDINTDRLDAAADRGMRVHEVNIETQPLPMADASVDIILSFGMIEHLRTYDGLLAEMRRVLRPDGWYLLGFPNLGSWLNRINLLRGYQPRDVEVSQEYPVGYAPGYPCKNTLGHLHSATDRCMRELLEAHDLEVRVSAPAFPYQQGVAVRIIDAVASLHPPLARRLLYAGTRTETS